MESKSNNDSSEEIIAQLRKQLKRVSNKLVREQNKSLQLNNVIALIPGNVYWMDKEGIFRGCNNNQLRKLGLHSQKDFVGKTYEELLHPEDAERVKEINTKVVRGGQSYTVEEQGLDDSGNEAIYLTTKVPLLNEDSEIAGLVGMSVDITERKNMEKDLEAAKIQAQAANELKTEFVRNMQHDIRTPLSGIYGIAFAIKKTAKDEQIQEYAENIETASTELINFCNTILDFSTISGGFYPILEKKFSIKSLISNIIVMNKPVAAQKRINLVVKIPDESHDTLIGDDFRIQRILMNLVGNALKFTQEGSVGLSVEEMQIKTDPRHILVKLIVQDTGIGMPKEKQKIIFEKFTRLDPSNRGIYKGAGLGLNIVKEFVCDLDGDIEVISDANIGTTIVCTIPFKLPLVDEMLEEN